MGLDGRGFESLTRLDRTLLVRRGSGEHGERE
jgi:hypothetical protein